MKKLFLTLTAAVAVTLAANAQTEKGKVILGGNVSYDYSKVKDVDGDIQGFTILPSVGYFVGNNVAVGLGVGYSWAQEGEGSERTRTGEFAVAPFARWYKGDGDFKFFGQLSVPMGWGTLKEDGTKVANTQRYGVALSPGFAYFPTSRIGLEFSVTGLYYNNSTVENEESGAKVTTNSFGLDANSLAPRVGIQFYF